MRASSMAAGASTSAARTKTAIGAGRRARRERSLARATVPQSRRLFEVLTNFPLFRNKTAQRFQARIPGKPGHFAALAYGGGQIYTATGDGVAAFQLVGLSTPAPPGSP